MRKLFVIFMLVFCVFILSSCSSNDTAPNNDQIVSLPDSATKITINGYKGSSSEESSNASQINEDKIYTIVGNKNSMKYHLIACKYAQKISDSNKIYFNNIDEAKNKKYSPCSVCLK